MATINSSPQKKYDIYPDRTSLNSSRVFVNESLTSMYERYCELYRTLVGQAPQELERTIIKKNKKTGSIIKRTIVGWAPIREGVCPVLPDTTIDDFSAFIEWLADRGIKVIAIYIHQDEGHVDLETNKRIYNYHAHLVMDFFNTETGKTVKLKKNDLREMQTALADSLGMERGISKSISGANHLTPDQFRAKKVAEDVARLEEKKDQLERVAIKMDSKVSEVKNALIKNLRQLCSQMHECVDKIGSVIFPFLGTPYNMSNILGDEEKKSLGHLVKSVVNFNASKLSWESAIAYLKEMPQYLHDAMRATLLITSKLASDASCISPSREQELLAQIAALKLEVKSANESLKVAETDRIHMQREIANVRQETIQETKGMINFFMKINANRYLTPEWQDHFRLLLAAGLDQNDIIGVFKGETAQIMKTVIYNYNEYPMTISVEMGYDKGGKMRPLFNGEISIAECEERFRDQVRLRSTDLHI